MIHFLKPENLNGTELREELRSAGIQISNEKEAVKVIDNELLLDIEESDKTKAFEIVKSHNGTILPSEPTVEEKLASVGLNLNDLKLALGL